MEDVPDSKDYSFPGEELKILEWWDEVRWKEGDAAVGDAGLVFWRRLPLGRAVPASRKEAATAQGLPHPLLTGELSRGGLRP